MKIGWCAPLVDAGLIDKIGYDYIEVPLAALGLEDQEAFKASKKAVVSSPLPIAAFNYFFPRDMRVVGPNVDARRVKSYLARAADLMNSAGARVCVLGSSWARNVPENWERARATEQFLETLGWCADALAGTSVTLAIEPLNRKESNIINSVAEGARFAARVDRPEIQVLADFYHMDEEREPLETLTECRDRLVHIHLADTGRKNPGTGTYDYDRFFGILKEINYVGMISGECTIDDPEADLRHSLQFLRRHWPDREAALK